MLFRPRPDRTRRTTDDADGKHGTPQTRSSGGAVTAPVIPPATSPARRPWSPPACTPPPRPWYRTTRPGGRSAGAGPATARPAPPPAAPPDPDTPPSPGPPSEDILTTVRRVLTLRLHFRRFPQPSPPRTNHGRPDSPGRRRRITAKHQERRGRRSCFSSPAETNRSSRPVRRILRRASGFESLCGGSWVETESRR